MLVLSRKSQEQIQIGDRITISILKVRGNVVRVGIEAPTNVRIIRGEITPFETTEEKSEPVSATMTNSSGARDPNSPDRNQPHDSLSDRLRRRMATLKNPPIESKTSVS